MIEAAIQHKKPVRIGVNWGSLDPALIAKMMDENASLKNPKTSREVTHDALIQSALTSAQRAEDIGLNKNQIIVSCKVSEVQDLISVYGRLAKNASTLFTLD